MAKNQSDTSVDPKVTEPEVTVEPEVTESDIPVEPEITTDPELGDSLEITPTVAPVTAVASGVEYAVIKPFMSTDKATAGKRVNFGFIFKSGSVFSDAYVTILVNVGHVVPNTKEVQAQISATKASVQSQQLIEGTMVVGDVDSIMGVVDSSEAILEQK